MADADNIFEGVDRALEEFASEAYPLLDQMLEEMGETWGPIIDAIRETWPQVPEDFGQM